MDDLSPHVPQHDPRMLRLHSAIGLTPYRPLPCSIYYHHRRAPRIHKLWAIVRGRRIGNADTERTFTIAWLAVVRVGTHTDSCH